MLLQIRDYIRKAKVVSNQQLAREFQIDIQALQPMLQLWLAKGVIQRCEDKGNCKSSCFKCRTVALEYYQSL